jgi:hypothetical protein
MPMFICAEVSLFIVLTLQNLYKIDSVNICVHLFQLDGDLFYPMVLE